MTEALRPAPYPADTKAKGWRFELDLEQLSQSETWALAGKARMGRPVLLMLYAKAWQQTPCGSISSDEAVIAARLGLSKKTFDSMKGFLLRGWWTASDGRLYHPTLTDRVLEMLAQRNVGSYRRFRAAVLERDGEVCAYCGLISSELTLDHVIARSKGGADTAENLTPACRSCNSSKGAKSVEEWMGASHE